MRELTLIETGCLGGLLILSLVLPLMMSFRNPQNPTVRKACLRIVWFGQAVLAIAGLGLLFSAPLAPYAALFGVATCAGCARELLRQSRNMAPIEIRK